MDEKTLILSLIKDDLTNQKLINNFRDMRIDAQDYQLHLASTIFDLMNIERKVEDTSFDNYMLFASMAKYLPIDAPNEFKTLAAEIYTYLDQLPRNPVKETTNK